MCKKAKLQFGINIYVQRGLGKNLLWPICHLHVRNESFTQMTSWWRHCHFKVHFQVHFILLHSIYICSAFHCEQVAIQWITLFSACYLLPSNGIICSLEKSAKMVIPTFFLSNVWYILHWSCLYDTVYEI